MLRAQGHEGSVLPPRQKARVSAQRGGRQAGSVVVCQLASAAEETPPKLSSLKPQPLLIARKSVEEPGAFTLETCESWCGDR